MSEVIEKLDHGQRHILKLISRDKKEDGWAKVSEQLFKVLQSSIPEELVEFEKLQVGGRARLTQSGQEVVNAMAWI